MKISPAPFRGLLFSRAEQLEPSQTKRGADVVALLERARSNSWPPAGNGMQARHHRSGQRGGPHTSKATRAELAGREPWPAPGWLPKYAPELNGIERDWKTLKAHRLAHKPSRTGMR